MALGPGHGHPVQGKQKPSGKLRMEIPRRKKPEMGEKWGKIQKMMEYLATPPPQKKRGLDELNQIKGRKMS